MERTASLLESALLGLLRQAPASGYDLRKIFVTTPMGSFSDSPGAIYPALKRLEARGLVRGKVEERGGLRRRNVFRPTSDGEAALKRWLAKPVTREDVAKRMDELLLRFAFMEAALGRMRVLRFLEEFERALAAYVPELRGYLQSNRAAMPTSAWLALDSGVRQCETQLAWCRAAIREYDDAQNKGKRR